MTTGRAQVDVRADPGPAGAVSRGLADPGRPAILRECAPGELRVLVQTLGLARRTVPGHLACLRGRRLGTSLPGGGASPSSPSEPASPELLTAAERLVAASGEEVDLGPDHGTGDGTGRGEGAA